MADALEFRFRDRGKNKLAATIGRAVRRADFRQSQTRWRRFSFALAALYCSHLYMSTNSPLIQFTSAPGVFFCLGCIFPSRFGRLKYPDQLR